ncbi:hypothetical protein L2E82_47342 [Cichorium intybus]|uniref:Uncharacterized protein n=1 Tax=Cichorium intybus TaxID=13427 RepID=A0ACB8YVY0_CICIN|nr:hypothetical protein L2E82_47342 [Cichorium intybus]
MIPIGKNQGVDSGTSATTIVARPYAASSLTYSLLRRNPNGTGCLIPPSNTIAQEQVDSGKIDEALKLFKEVEDKDVISWTTMIVGHVQNGKEEDALMLFSEMLMSNIKPDKFKISTMIRY